MQRFSLLIIALLFNYSIGSFFSSLNKSKDKHLRPTEGADVGDPLILTPFIQNGSILEAQQAALVKDTQFYDITSYAGYFTVDDRFNSNLWFWYFPSAGNVTEDPVVLWLSGGPGVSSLMSLFQEHGPFIINSDLSVSLREYSWHRNQSVIFVDNPVGAGFSFTDGGLAENETKVGDDMYSALNQFFQLFPNLQKNPFYISGESFAGQYLPAVGHAILKNTPQAELKINLQGLLIGNGWTDPINQLNYGPFVYNLGLASAAQKVEMDATRDKAITLYEAGDWQGALDQMNNIFELINKSSNIDYYNYVTGYGDWGPWQEFLNTEEIRIALHVGNVEFGDKGAGDALDLDGVHSVAPWVEELLEHCRVLVYTGQVDIIVGYPMALEYLQKLNFTGAEDYHNSSRDIWYVDEEDEPAGYVRSGGNLVELLVRNAGHFVTGDQPKWAYDMLYKFTRNIPYA